MIALNSFIVEIIPTIDITTIHTKNTPSIHIEHFFDIQELEKVGIKLGETLFFYGSRHSSTNNAPFIYNSSEHSCGMLSLPITWWLYSNYWEPKWCFIVIPLPRPLSAFLRVAFTKKGGRETMTPMWQGLYTKRMLKKWVIKRPQYTIWCVKGRGYGLTLLKIVIHKQGQKLLC